MCVTGDDIGIAETWSLTTGIMKKLKVTQWAMERAMLGVSLCDRIETRKSVEERR